MTDETKIIPLDATPELPKDLQAQAYTIRAFAQTFNMLQDGLFPTTHFSSVQSCLGFLKEVHAQAVTAPLNIRKLTSCPSSRPSKSNKRWLKKKAKRRP
jgi:hypothetical protein